MGEYETALELQGRALALWEELGSKRGVGVTLPRMASARLSVGDHFDALRLYERAHRLMEEAGDRSGAAATLMGIGLVHSTVGAHRDALDCYERALKLFESLGARGNIGPVMNRIATQHEALGDHARALEGYETYVSLGQSRPFTSTTVTGGAYYPPVVSRSTEFRGVQTGFYATPRVSGDRVTLEISSRQQRMTDATRNAPVTTGSLTTTPGSTSSSIAGAYRRPHRAGKRKRGGSSPPRY